jgi:hypothetical protein
MFRSGRSHRPTVASRVSRSVNTITCLAMGRRIAPYAFNCFSLPLVRVVSERLGRRHRVLYAGVHALSACWAVHIRCVACKQNAAGVKLFPNKP